MTSKLDQLKKSLLWLPMPAFFRLAGSALDDRRQSVG